MISYAAREFQGANARAGSAARTFSSSIAWAFGSILFFGVIGGILALLMSPDTAYIGVAAGCVLVIVCGRSARMLRKKRARLILAYVAQAMQMNLPLSTILQAAAKSEPRPVARRIERLRAALEDGSPIGAAVASAVPQVPRRIVDLTAVAERNGRLPQVLRRLLDDHYPNGPGDRLLGFYESYALILLLVISGVITIFAIFIMPRYQQLLKDFKMPVPAMTQDVMVLAQTVAPIVCGIAVIFTLIAEGQALRQLFTSGRPRTNPLTSLADHVVWYLPVAGTLAAHRGLADVCATIADGVEAGRPIDQALMEAVQPHLNAVLRARIHNWAEYAASGVALADAAHRAKLPAIIGGIAGTAVRAGNLPAALRFLSRHYESSFSRTAMLLQAAVVPAVVLSLGGVVMCVALALFEPMIELIQAAEFIRYR